MGIRSRVNKARHVFSSRAETQALEAQAALDKMIDSGKRLEARMLARDENYRTERCADYPSAMGQSIGRVALVTNFTNHYIEDASNIAETLIKVQKPADLTVIQVVLPDRTYQSRAGEYLESSTKLGDEIEAQQLSGEVSVIENPVYEEGLIVPETIAGLVEHHVTSNPGKSISYVAITSALELDRFGLGVERGHLGATGEVYNSIVGGGIILPSSEAYHDSRAPWTPQPRKQ